MSSIKLFKLVIGLILFSLTLIGCDREKSTDAPKLTATSASPTATLVSALLTDIPTATPEPTLTPTVIPEPTPVPTVDLMAEFTARTRDETLLFARWNRGAVKRLFWQSNTELFVTATNGQFLYDAESLTESTVSDMDNTILSPITSAFPQRSFAADLPKGTPL